MLSGDRCDLSCLMADSCDRRVRHRDSKFYFNDVVDAVNVHSQKVSLV